ncbi:MAG TPA: hypothetical protein VK714_05080 [Myxococcota bacterium]|nr:hypothetical protein [Myxococcota bacterium]
MNDAIACDESASTRVPSLRREILLWGALALALSPVLRDIGKHVIAHPWAGYSAVFAALLVLAARHQPQCHRPKVDGYLLLAVGLLVELVGIGGGIDRLARPALPLGVIGLARLLGRPPLAVALLALGMVPVPAFVLGPVAAMVGPALAGLTAMTCTALGLSLHAQGATLASVSGVIELGDGDTGLPLAILLAGLGWYAGLGRTSRETPVAASKSILGQAARMALRWAPWAFPIQVGAVVGAGIVLSLGGLAWSRMLLLCGVWILTAAVGLLRAAGRERSV